MKTAARVENVLEQLNKGLPPEVREADTPENSMQPMPDVKLAKSKILQCTAQLEPGERNSPTYACKRDRDG